MSEANVIFTLKGANSTIKCSTEDKLREICQKYSTKIKEKIYFYIEKIKLILN